jgi:hypothetical protein
MILRIFMVNILFVVGSFLCKWTCGVLHVTWSNEWSCGKGCRVWLSDESLRCCVSSGSVGFY